MKLKNKFVYALLVGCVLLSGCSNSSSTATDSVAETQEAVNTDTSSEADVDTAVTEEGSAVTGMIESIDETAQTITLSSMPQGQGGAPGGGSAPDGEAPGGNMPNGEAPSGDGAPDGEAPNGDGAPDGEAPNGDGAPDGEAPNGDGAPDGEAPSGDGTPGGETPSGDGAPGDMPSGDVPQMPDNIESITVSITDSTVITDESGAEITLSDLSEGTMITVTVDAENNALTISLAVADNGMMQMGAPGGNQSGAPSSYTAVNTYTSDTTLSQEAITSTGVDENAVLVQEQASVSIDNSTIDRTSADSTGGDSSSFYGIGAAVLVTDGTVEVTNSTITTDAAGGAGVFAYGDGVAYVSDSTITTTQNTSGGIHVAGGGTLYAENLTVETDGESAAAVRSDRGGGTMTVNGGSYTSNGVGSPAVYCTADITIADAVLTATGSEAICIEGLNSLSLTNCDVTGDMDDLSQNDCTWTVILYQSLSGDSEIGNSTFSMQGGSLTSLNGGLFYTTNTESTFYLSDVDISYSDSNAFFLKCTGNSNQRGWGQSGANGADCSFTADAQDMIGDILWDSISTLDFIMSNGSTLTGAFVQDESSVTSTGSGYANLTIDAASTWIVTGDSVLSSLTCKGTITDADNNTVTIQDADGNILVEGTSDYTITVDSYTE